MANKQSPLTGGYSSTVVYHYVPAPWIGPIQQNFPREQQGCLHTVVVFLSTAEVADPSALLDRRGCRPSPGLTQVDGNDTDGDRRLQTVTPALKSQ